MPSVPRRIDRVDLPVVWVQQTPITALLAGAGRDDPIPSHDLLATVQRPPWGTLIASLARHEEPAMNTSAIDTVVIELAEEYQPAEVLNAWSERPTAVD